MRKAVEKNSIGYRVRQARLGLNMTQKQLANIVNVVPTYITAIERGNRNASEELIERIAAATHTTKEWLIGTSENQTSYPEPDTALPQVKGDTASMGFAVRVPKESGHSTCQKTCLYSQGLIGNPIFGYIQKTSIVQSDVGRSTCPCVSISNQTF